jgi:hypothetical protein
MRAARPPLRQAQNNKLNKANKPLVAGKTKVVNIGLRASNMSMIFPVCLQTKYASVPWRTQS